MTLRIAPWLVLLGASVPLSASPVTSCGVQPSGQTCSQVTTSLTPFPSITAEASATDAVAYAGSGIFDGPIQGLTFDFEVVGPPITAVHLDLGVGGTFGGGYILGDGWSCLSGSFLPYSIQCSGAEIISPGFYYGGNAIVPPLETGRIALPIGAPVWLVPNEWNQATLGAGAGALALSTNPSVTGVSLDSISTTSMHLVIDPMFPNAADYQIVIAPEPASGVLLAIGLVALFAMACRRKRASAGNLEH